MTKFSIILPIFNVEKYLPTCLDSLIKQTYNNIEIICVNDGSTDNSLDIINNYSHRDKRIKVINQCNQGVSVARNNGLTEASGNFILFVDPDDWLDVKTCEYLNDEIEKGCYDLIYFNQITTTNDKSTKKRNIKCLKKEHKYVYSNALMKCCCYRHEFLTDRNIYFLNGVKISEDNIFSLYCLFSSPKICLLDKFLYFYRADNATSATKKWDSFLTEQIKSLKILEQQDFYQNLSNKDKLYITDLWAFYIFTIYNKLPQKSLEKSYKQTIKEFLKSYSKYSYRNYFYLYGYNLLKFKEIILILLKIKKILLSDLFKVGVSI